MGVLHKIDSIPAEAPNIEEFITTSAAVAAAPGEFNRPSSKI